MVKNTSDVAYYAIIQIQKTLVNRGVNIDSEITAKTEIETIFQHGQHIKVHNVNQTSVDPYKIVCWYGFSLLDILQLQPNDCEKLYLIVESMIATLEAFLNQDSKGLVIFPPRTRTFLLQLIIEEQKGNGSHGIGMNGLYAAFHCAVATLNSINNPKERMLNL